MCAGLTNSVDVRPWGYNSSSNKPAEQHLEPVPPPKAYNLHAAPMPKWAKKHTPVGKPGLAMPPLKRQDQWGNVNADVFDGTSTTGYTPLALPGPPWLKSAPTTTPWSERAAIKLTNAVATSGAIEPPKPDILTLAQTILSTTTNVADKQWWEQRVNALAHLETISSSRPLTVDESKRKEDISKEIIEKSRTGPLAATAAGYVPNPVPATAAEIAALLAAHVVAPPVAPAALPAGPPALVPPLAPPAGLPAGPPAGLPAGLPAGPPAGPPAKLPVVLHASRIIKNNNLGPANTDFADVKSDALGNRVTLLAMLKQKYPNKVPQHDKEMWESALQPFGGPNQVWGSVTVPATLPFPDFIMSYLNSHDSDIFVTYLVEPDSYGMVGPSRITQYVGTRRAPGKIDQIAASSVHGKFFYHPNYTLV